MSQEQPSSLLHYRALRDRMGCELALVNAASDVDHLTDQLGRRLDLLATVRVTSLAAAYLLGILTVWMVACAAIGEEKSPHDWPALSTTVIYSDNVAQQCGKYALMPLACAEVNFEKKTCTIYTAVKWEWVLVHEQEHCAGKDHENETSLRDAWKKYKEAK